MAQPGHSTADVAALAVTYIARTRRQSDLSANVYFDDTEIDYRDDNRHLWRYIEAGDEEESFEAPRRQVEEAEPDRLPPRHYPEWDYLGRLYRPDWVSLYESLHPPGDAGQIDRLPKTPARPCRNSTARAATATASTSTPAPMNTSAISSVGATRSSTASSAYPNACRNCS